MSKAIQCDRCEKFAGAPKNAPRDSGSTHFPGWKAISTGEDLSYNREPIFLCPECYEQFERFMRGISVTMIEMEKQNA